MAGRIRKFAAGVLGATSLLGTAAWAGEVKRDGIATGVRVGGVDVGGLSEAEALETVRRVWDERLREQLTIRVDGQSHRVAPRDLGVQTDAEKRVRDAARLAGVPLRARLLHIVTGADVHAGYDVRTLVDEPAVHEYVARLARRVDRGPRNSRIDTSSGFVRIVQHRDGFSLSAAAAEKLIASALRDGRRVVEVPGRTVRATVRSSSHGDVLLVRVGENRLYHYRGDRLVKRYDVATGRRGHETPEGAFEIVRKRRNPTWVNPSPDGWGSDLPERIGPGRSNPLGTRALDLDARAIRIHGTSDTASIGYNASHGCIRMRMRDVEELFARVSVGTPVYVVRAGPLRVQPDAKPELVRAEDDATVIQAPAGRAGDA